MDLILTDLKLPDGSGLQVLKAAPDRLPECLVTLITGFSSLETAIEAIRASACAYLTKPFTLDEIGSESET